MKKYNDNDVVVKGFDYPHLKGKSVVEVLDMLSQISDFRGRDVEDELKDFQKEGYEFGNGKKYVVVCKIGCRGLFEGIEVIREGEVLLEKDLIYGSDYWKFRKEMLEDLEKEYNEYKEGKGFWKSWDKEEYERDVMLYREGSNDEVFEYSMCGCINEEYGDEDYIGCEFDDDQVWYYYVVDRLR